MVDQNSAANNRSQKMSPGTVVRVIGTRTLMTVEFEPIKARVRTVWFDAEDCLHRDEFDAAILEVSDES